MTGGVSIGIRALATADRDAALDVINHAARWYEEFLPPDQVHAQEMTAAQWDAEGRRMTWYGAFLGDRLLAVMGLEPKGDAALIRHGYVLPGHQRQGVGSLLLAHLERAAGVERILIGTYAANHKARANLEKAGYRLCPDSAGVLDKYFAIPPERAQSSVAYEKWDPHRGTRL